MQALNGPHAADNEKRLVKKCRELNSEIVANAAKVQTALKLSEEDQLTIKSLKKEIEKAWKMVDSSYEKEARAKETISHLKLEISNLTRLVEQGAGMSLGEESAVNDLLKQKEELTKELDAKVRAAGFARDRTGWWPPPCADACYALSHAALALHFWECTDTSSVAVSDCAPAPLTRYRAAERIMCPAWRRTHDRAHDIGPDHTQETTPARRVRADGSDRAAAGRNQRDVDQARGQRGGARRDGGEP
jgi:hypothetical protein